MILVHDDGDVWILFDSREDEVAQKGLTGIGAGTGRRLHNHRAGGFVGGLHDCLNLLQVVDVERRYAVAVFGCMIE